MNFLEIDIHVSGRSNNFTIEETKLDEKTETDEHNDEPMEIPIEKVKNLNKEKINITLLQTFKVYLDASTLNSLSKFLDFQSNKNLSSE